MIVSDNDAKTTTGKSKKENKKSVKIAEEKIEEIVPEEEEEEISADHGLDERTIQENRRMFSQKKGKKTPKSPNPKSPGKEGKKPTNWDSVVFGGKISKEAE